MRELTLPKIVAVGVYDAAQAHRGKTVTPPRKTTMFELELPLAEGGISYIGTESRAIRPDTVICAKPGQMRHTRLPYKCLYVHAVVGEGVLYDMLSRLPDYAAPADMREIRAIFSALPAEFGVGTPESEVCLQSGLLRLIYLLAKESGNEGHTPKRNHHEIIERALAYIEQNLTADLRLETVSALAGFTPVYFHKLFKASTGRTLREYVEERRIRRAIALLTESDRSLTRIAFECGFSSQAYFSAAFKKKMGCPPREYARRIYQNYET